MISAPETGDDAKRIATREGIRDPAPSTVKNTVQIVNRALRLMGERTHGVASPVRGVSMPKANPGRTRRLSADEERLLFTESAKINPLAPLIIRFALLTALRRERCLTVRRSNIIGIGDGRQVISFPKEAGAKRTGIVPVTRAIQEIITEALSLSGDQTSNDYLVFNVSIETFESWFERALKSAGIVDFRFHDLRHEATSRLLELGLSAAEVMSITGHSTNDMLDRYSHYSSILILKKIENRSFDAKDAILDEIGELVRRYREIGGDEIQLRKMLI